MQKCRSVFSSASNRSRTCTHLREQRPERCASANSAIEATFRTYLSYQKVDEVGKVNNKILILKNHN